MKRQVRVFVEGQKLDLFNDENIEVTSTIQNIQDISKTYTDFSQSFTIPTSATNTAIWQYFYENAVNTSINYQERLNGYIEIDMAFFRRGKIQMEKSQLKNGQPDSYTITFYGDITTLKDIVGEDLLSDLNYSTLNHDYNFNEVYTRVTDIGTDYDVCYPLITSNRIWAYNNASVYADIPAYVVSLLGLTANDIHTNAGAIDYRELFPAVRVKSILDCIEQTYAIKFNGAFLTDPKFTQAYLWFKNKNTFEFTGEAQDIIFNSLTSSSTPNYPLTNYVDLTLGKISTVFQNGAFQQTILITINSVSSTTIPYYVDVYRNGAIFCTLNGIGTTINGNLITIPNIQGLNDYYTFQVRSTASLTIDFNIEYRVWYLIGATPVYDYVTYDTITNTLTTYTDLAQLAPQIKVNEFLAGILKQFNLTCFGSGIINGTQNYTIIPLADWYASGAVIDITEFTDKNDIGIDRVKLYKKIGFAFEQSSSLMNKAYFNQGLKEYGNTEYQYPYDGGEFTVKVPFENLLFNQFNDSSNNPTGLQVGYSLDSSFAPYIPKPCLLYKFGGINLADHIVYTDGASHVSNHDYMMFGQDLTDNGIDYSLNFAPETSSYWLAPIQQSIFATYYFPYLTNLFNPKNRLTTIKANLPVSILTGLQLNDRLIIRDKRYIINEMKTNLVTGECMLQLLNDFMPVLPERTIITNPAQESISVPISFPQLMNNNVLQAMFFCDNPDVILPDPILEPQTVTFILPPTRTPDVITINVNFDFTNGETQVQPIIIIRQ
jgi:hypothetical protein